MTKKKPKGPTPSLIGSSNGRPKRTEVKRLSSCSRCKDQILLGMTCIEIPKVGGAFASSKRVCDPCYQDILAKTAADFETIKTL